MVRRISMPILIHLVFVFLSTLSCIALQRTTALVSPTQAPVIQSAQEKVIPPPQGRLYHGAFPGGTTGEEDDITLDGLHSYEQAAGKPAAWVYFSHNWYRSRSFPLETAAWVRDAGSIPYIRLMLRSGAEQYRTEPAFTLERIAGGDFDDDLQAWSRAARDFGTPLIAEFGTEVNGEWFPWNGSWNGSGTADDYGDPTLPDGPERFVDAYRRIIQVSRNEGAGNILWVFHVNHSDVPDEAWNRFEQYYPGEEWVDWIGVSAYGALTPMDEECQPLRTSLDEAYPRLAALSPAKPIVLLEFGAAARNPNCDQAAWAEAALADLTGRRWPRLIGFSWWNESWQNDDDPANDTTMRLQDNPQLASVFQEMVGGNEAVLGKTVTSSPGASPLFPSSTPEVWRPAIGESWQWQLTGLPVDRSHDVGVYDIDLFDNDAGTVAALHAQGARVVCYLSAGSWEDWRPDEGQFPAGVIGSDYEGWEGEKWLDIRQVDLLAPVMRARLDLCREKGFDAVEPDNIDGYTSDTGFPLTAEDQLRYNTWLADEAHKRGLSIGLKNDPEQAASLEPLFDWALTEDCFAEDWCDQMLPFIEKGKAVLSAEYTDTGTALEDICPEAERLRFSVILKNRDLDAYRAACQ